MELTNTVTVVEIVVSLLVTWPLIRQLSFAPFRYRVRCKATQRAVLLTGYVAFVGGVAVFVPVALHLVAAPAAALLIFERWRARPHYGRSRGLPPGSLALVSRGQERNPNYYETLIPRYGPIFKLSREFRPYVYIYGHERAIKFLRDNDDVLVGLAQPISATIPKGFIRYMPASIHSNYRRILQSGIAADAIEDASPLISHAVRRTLARIAEDCRRSPAGRVDFDDYLGEMIFVLVLQFFFAAGRDTPMFDRVAALYDDIDTRTDNCGAGPKRQRAMAEMMSVLHHQVDAHAMDPGAGPPCFLRAMSERNDAASIDATVLGNWAGMVEFATIDIFGLVRWLVKMLIDHPEWVDTVRQEQTAGFDQAKSADVSVAARIVKETLRLERSEFLTRKALQDIWFEGYRIPKGWAVRIGIREGNRNSEVFDRPAEFDPDRFLDKTYALTEYAPFGLYRHNCLGADFASTIGRVFVGELATGFDLEKKGEWTTEYTPPHWRPRAGYRIGLKERAN